MRTRRNRCGSGACGGGPDRHSRPGSVGGCDRSILQSMGQDPYARAVPAEIPATTPTKLQHGRPKPTSGKCAFACSLICLSLLFRVDSRYAKCLYVHTVGRSARCIVRLA